MKDGLGGIDGLGVVEPDGRLVAHFGAASDVRIRTLLGDREWLSEAAERRMVSIAMTDQQYTAIVASFKGGYVILLFLQVNETVLRFLLNVDFAFDIIEHILTDPFDAMAVIDAKERLVFISPIHEKFFGLASGQGVGRPVREVIENTRLHKVLRTGVAEIGQLQKMKGRERVVSRHPIRHGGKVVGAIGRVMFKGPQQVEELSRRVNALEKEIATYRNEAKGSLAGEAFLDAIIGQSAAIQSVRDQIRKIAPLDIPVLIHGESGTGKELVAQALHMMSARREARLVTVNAAALPAQLVESELFGYEAGSFTGADKKGRAGKFEQADKGTIFLDEIGDMPLDVQSKLLRVLQDRIVERVGGETPRKIDFRLCSATNRDLEDYVEQGKFRLDLFYRISPVVIRLPSLTDRVDDIPLLLKHFINDLAKQYKRERPEISANVYDYLMERCWPGNIRELRYTIERAFVFCEDNRLTLENFQTDSGTGTPQTRSQAIEDSGRPGGNLRQALEKVERDLMAEAMTRFNGNKKKVAEHLGVSRSYLYKKIGE